MSISQNYPNVSPQLLIDLSNTQKLDPRIVFSRASTGTYYDANGVLQTAPSGVARFQFDPVTGVSEGLLRENQATNLYIFGKFTAKNTIQSNFNETLQGAIAPDGTMSATVWHPIFRTDPGNSALTVRAFRQIGIAPVAGVTYTISLYVKPINAISRYPNPPDTSEVDRDLHVRLSCEGIGARNFNLNGITPFVGQNHGVLDIGNGWYRIWTTHVAFGDTSPNCFIFFSNRTFQANFDPYPSGEEECWLWGWQVEEGEYPSSIILTDGAQVTRAADVATLANVDAYNTDEFTAVTKPFGVSGVASNLVTLNGDAPIERLYVYPRNISQNEINTLVENDGWWNWRIVGANFALPSFTTDGTVIVDWGDGTIETLTTAVHTFANASPHTVRFKLTSGTYFRPRIDDNATHKTKVVALGSAPSNMIADCLAAFYGCANLKSFDATLIGGTSFFRAWFGCSGLTSFPLINTSAGTTFKQAWYFCSGLTSFPLIDTSAGASFDETWRGCSSLTSFPLINTSASADFSQAWQDCSSLTSFPLINTSAGTNFSQTWFGCSSLTSFPAIDTSSGTNFSDTWNGCTSLTSFPLLDMSLAENLNECWHGCSSLTSFPAIDFPVCTYFGFAWDGCSSLSSFPLIDTSSGTNFDTTWRNCSSITAFPLIDISSGTFFRRAWNYCSSLTDFPANFFDSWTGVPITSCFVNTWLGCSALTTTSVENILVSIDTSAVSAPATGTEITIDYDTGTGALTSATNTAITSLKAKNWTIKINGVLE